MLIDVYTCAWNEEKILPFFLDYYSQFANKIYIIDNGSTDSSFEIYAKYPKVQIFKNPDQTLNDMAHAFYKSNLYRTYSRGVSDWAINVDTDEFLYHPNLLELLKEYKDKGVQLPKVYGYDMVSETFPTYTKDKLITDLVKTGFHFSNYSKRCIVDPNVDFNYGVGCHPHTTPVPEVIVESEDESLLLLHYKCLSFDYLFNRFVTLRGRLSEVNKKYGLGFHYNTPKETLLKEFKEKMEKSTQVIQ